MAEKRKENNKLKARLPRGLADRGPAEIAATRAMIEKIRAVYERYGFEPVETPAIEYTDALGKFLPDQDRPNEGVFSFQDDDEQWLSLRYDLTAPLARYVAENFDALPKPYRSYRFGWVFRNEKPGPGPLPPVHAVRCRHGRLSLARRRRRDVHDGRGYDGGVGHSARLLCGEGLNNRKLLDGVMERMDSELKSAWLRSVLLFCEPSINWIVLESRASQELLRRGPQRRKRRFHKRRRSLNFCKQLYHSGFIR